MTTYDVVVLGLGSMGSATLANLARRGRRTLGLEQFRRGHELGSSNGRSRLIRKAYYEHPSYVPLVLRAYDAWREIEALTSCRILHVTGLLLAGNPDSEIITGTARSAKIYDLPLDHLDASDIRKRFPMCAPQRTEAGLFEPEGGYLIPESAVDAFLTIAERYGAELSFETPVLGWELRPSGVRVRLADGRVIEAARLVVCAGPWFATLSADTAMPIELRRNVQLWFRPRSDAFGESRCPAFMIDRAGFPEILYGVPDDGYGLKAAFQAFGQALASAQDLDRGVRAQDVDPVAEALESWMPGAAGELLEGRACMYSVSPDRHFVVGFHPCDPRVILAGGFSGHGFKFASVLGEVLADLALEGGTRYDLEFLSPTRFA